MYSISNLYKFLFCRSIYYVLITFLSSGYYCPYNHNETACPMYTYNDLSEAMNETWCLDCPAGESNYTEELNVIMQIKICWLTIGLFYTYHIMSIIVLILGVGL